MVYNLLTKYFEIQLIIGIEAVFLFYLFRTSVFVVTTTVHATTIVKFPQYRLKEFFTHTFKFELIKELMTVTM